MKNNIVSFFLTVLILIVILATIVLSMDLCGVISLPAKFSLKTYLPDSIEVAAGEDNIYYPDYEATGIQNLVDENSNLSETLEDSSSTDLSNAIHSLDSSNTQTNIDTNSNITDNSFYYNQLNTYGKTIYSKLFSNLDNLKTGKYVVDFGITFNELLQTQDGEKELTNAFQLAINALLLDHPEIFYLDVTKMFMFTESTTTLRGTTYKISIGPDETSGYLAEGFNSEGDVLVAEDNLETMLYIIKSNVSGNTYNKAKQVHDYLVDNVEYDSESSTDLSHGIYGTLVNRLAVCDGYAKSFKYVLDSLGISCVQVCGIGQNSSGNSESHAWNDVLLNGKWYAVDVTWDDPIIIGGGGHLTNELKYNYFLKGSDTFYGSHREDGFIVENGSFTYPIISEYGY